MYFILFYFLHDRIFSALTYAAGIEVDPGNVPEVKKGCNSNSSSSSSSSSSSNSSSSSSRASISIGEKEELDGHHHSHDHDHNGSCMTPSSPSSSSSSSSSSSLNSHSDSSSSSSSSSDGEHNHGSPISDSSTTSSSSESGAPSTGPTGSGTLYERLKVCPLHCVPLSREVSGTGHSEGLNPFGAKRYRPPTPVVLGSPDSKVKNSLFAWISRNFI